MNFNTIFFDLDSTLYPEANGLWKAIRNRIDLYLNEIMGFSPKDIPVIRHQFFVEHGTTLRGLQIHYQVNTLDYLNFVHDVPLNSFLEPDPVLRGMLKSIPHRLWVFTNSDAAHANRVMDILGIRDCFEDMIDVLRMSPLCKPNDEAYQLALELAGETDPKACVMLDDSINNLVPAKKMGFFTVLVGESEKVPSANRSLVDIHDLPRIVPEFWE